MSSVAIHTAFNIPASAPHPSISCLQWTADGQLLFLTKTDICILTPDLGINVDTSSAASSAPAKGNAVTRPLGWLKTIIALDKRVYHHWPAVSQEWSTASLGSLDLSLRAVTASPNNLTADFGCVLAVITSNLELILWEAVKNHLKGEWKKVQEGTTLLNDIASTFTADSPVRRVLQAQVTCCSWSAQADFGITPTPLCDGSLLAIGTRAGTVHLLRLKEQKRPQDRLTHVRTVHLSDSWVTHLAWTAWTPSGSHQCRATLACGMADGSISLVDVTQTLHVESGPSFSFLCRLEMNCLISPLIPHSADKKTITGLAWVKPPNRNPILMHCKPGLVHFWSDNETAQWQGSRTIQLQTQKISTGCSSVHPVSGIQYLVAMDTLILSLYDGSFHAIHGISSEPSLEPPSGADAVALPSSSSLSALSRAVFVRSENKPVRRVDMNRIDGMASYDGAQTFVWVYKDMCPSDFSYKSEAKLTSTLVVAEMWEGATDEAVIRTMHGIFGEAKITLERSPIDVLRPLFLRLRDENRMATLFPHVMTALQGPYPQTPTPSFPVVVEALSPEVRRNIRGSLARHLFGCEVLFSLRLKLAIADFCWKIAPDPQAQGECGTVAQGILIAISQCIHRVLVGHLTSVSGNLTECDMPFVLRIVLQCLLPETPEDLSTAAQTLSNNASASARVNATDTTINELEENCPACGVAVPLDNVTGATCPNGHTWSRCSITSFILSTPKVRTCLGCSRKAFLPPMGIQRDQENQSSVPMEVDGEEESLDNEHLPLMARSWIVEELLQATRRCLFCGNAFVVLL